MITKELQATLNLSANEAIKRRHEFLMLEHLLYAMLLDNTASDVIRNCGGDLDLLRRDLEDFFKETMHPLPRGVDRYPEQTAAFERSEEHTSELQSLTNLVCRLLLEKKKKHDNTQQSHTHTSC